MRQVLVIARREFANGFRNKWVLGAVVLMMLLSLSLALLGSAPAGEVSATPMTVLVVSLASLSVFLVPLIALLLAHDAIAGEVERGTLALTLAYPVARWHLLAGKFAGHIAILALATVLGYGAAAAAVAIGAGGINTQDFAALLGLTGTAIGLGGVFLSLGYLASTLVDERATAVAIAIALWLIFVIVYDLAFLGLLVAVESGIPDGLVSTLILLNPADVFRLLNLTASEAALSTSGMDIAGSKSGLGQATLMAALLAWLAAGLLLSWLALKRREV